ncbi:FimD/PapC N-terminal domain-containing protein, partial [Escherichia coli]
PANPHKSIACLTPQQLELLALKEEALTYIHPISAACYDISRLPGVVLNNSAGVLDITGPQAWMKYTDPDWTPPERWDNGVAGLIF